MKTPQQWREAYFPAFPPGAKVSFDPDNFELLIQQVQDDATKRDDEKKQPEPKP